MTTISYASLQGHAPIERFPWLADLARVALALGVVWTVAAGFLYASGRLPMWTLLSIPAGVAALTVYVRVIRSCPICKGACPLIGDDHAD